MRSTGHAPPRPDPAGRFSSASYNCGVLNTATVRAHAVVRGRVQMVGFRAFVQRHAGDAGLRGTVRNQPDGTVDAVLEGPSAAVERLLDLMRRGPSHARVDRVDVEYAPAGGDLPPMRVTA